MDTMKQLELANVRVFKNAKETGRLLGIGSFGCVVELIIKGAGKFAGKKIHEALIVDGDTSLLVKECKLMSELIHPNIAKFCGVCKLPSRTVPALVMELMDHSLEDFLENKTFHIALTTAISILIDIANGLTYLHGRTPSVLHRDLTARNVLLDKYTNAKITDFGNARIVNPEKVGKAMTQAPGTSVYMPPEALDPHSTYCARLDIFSFGHLALYTLIREFPKDLLPATYIEAEGHVVARSELERRSKYMETLNVKLPELDHQLYRLTQQCLQNDLTKRPDSTKLLRMLQEILCLEYGELYCKGTEELATDAGSKSPEEKYESPIKTGLIEKKSRMLSKLSERGAWRAHTFTINYQRGIFQYTRRGSFPARGPVIRLDDIMEIRELEQDGPRFPFEVHHRRKHSPWELRVYSKADRREWVERLQTCPDDTAASMASTETEKENFDLLGQTDSTLSIDECIYDKIIDVLNERFNPNQLDEFTKKLRSKTYATLPAHSSLLPATGAPRGTPTLSLPETLTLPTQQKLSTKPKLPPKPLGNILKRQEQPSPDKALPVTTPASSELSQAIPPRSPTPKRSMSVPEVKPLQRSYPSLASVEDEYECIESGPTSALKWTPETLSPPILPPRRSTSESEGELRITSVSHGNYKSADPPIKTGPRVSLEDLQKEALSISLSSLTNITKFGEGQFGDVYTAQMNTSTVAVKVIKRYSSKRVKEQFENEMSIMTQVAHHNIVRLHGIVREGPLSPALVMEFLPNGNLKTYLKREPQPNEFLMKCMSDIAMGMHYLCERGLIHRDLAARNILLDENKTCKVSDFGLLREVAKDKSVYISQGDGPSPLRWMAPESITDNIFSPASDMWSYGILQWEMFFPDKQPYYDMQTTKMIVKVASGYRMPIPRGCPALVAKIMKACWHHDPHERPTFLLISNLLNSRDRIH